MYQAQACYITYVYFKVLDLLRNFFHTNDKAANKVRLFKQPYCCIAKGDFDANKLMFVPASRNLSIRPAEKSIGLGPVKTGERHVRWYVNPDTAMGEGEQFVTPFWFVDVKHQKNPDDGTPPPVAQTVINMEIKWQIMKLKLPLHTFDDDVYMPFMTNCLPVKAGDRLVRALPYFGCEPDPDVAKREVDEAKANAVVAKAKGGAKAPAPLVGSKPSPPTPPVQGKQEPAKHPPAKHPPAKHPPATPPPAKPQQPKPPPSKKPRRA